LPIAVRRDRQQGDHEQRWQEHDERASLDQDVMDRLMFSKSIPARGEPAIDGGSGQRMTGTVQPGHPEQPQDRVLLADGRGGTRPGSPGGGERLGSLEQLVDGSLGQGRSRPQG